MSFRYQDSAVGTPTITTSAAGFTSASQIVTVANPPKLVFTSAPVTSFTATPGSQRVDLAWANPTDKPLEEYAQP